MLKKLAKRINKELDMACDYVEQANLLKYEHRDVADLFISLAGEKVEDIDRLYRAGYSMIEQKKDGIYSRQSNTQERESSNKSSHFDEAKTIWDWEYRISSEKLQELKQKISNYKR